MARLAPVPRQRPTRGWRREFPRGEAESSPLRWPVGRLTPDVAGLALAWNFQDVLVVSQHQELPASGARIIPFPDRASAARRRARARSEILIGIRNEAVREGVAVTLSDLGGGLVRAAEGIRLVEWIADVVLTDGLRPGLIVADATLPGCSGLALLESVRALHWTTPVIVLTSLEQVEERRAAWADGATGVFVAPLDLGQLRSFAALVLGRPDPD